MGYRIILVASTVLFGLAIAASALHLYRRAHFGWDMFGYIGVAASYVESDPAAIHETAYSSVERSAAPEVYDELTGEKGQAAEYRSAVAGNPDYLLQQLPFYSVKPAYPAAIALLHVLGIDYVRAGQLLSVGAYVLLAGLVLLWLRRHHPPPVAAVLALAICSLSFVTTVAQSYTPDMLSAVVVLAAFYAHVEAKRSDVASALFVASVLVRPDNAIWAGLFALYLATAGQRPKAGIVAGLGSLLVFVGATELSGNYGWTTLFYHSGVELLPAPAQFESPLGFSDYVSVYLQHLPSSVNDGTLLFVVLAGVAAAIRRQRHSAADRYVHALLVGVGFVVIHLLVFPLNAERMMLPAFVLTLVSLASLVRYRSREAQQPAAPKSAFARFGRGVERRKAWLPAASRRLRSGRVW